jgi:hypothetical protein
MEEEGEEKAKDDDDLHVRYDSYRIILYGAGGMILCTICTYRTSMQYDTYLEIKEN